MHRRVTGCAAVIVALGVASAAAQTNWPQFRGEGAGVAADDPRLPDSWGPDENLVWEMDIPGQSWSSPIVWGDHVFVVTAAAEGGGDAPLGPVETYRGEVPGRLDERGGHDDVQRAARVDGLRDRFRDG